LFSAHSADRYRFAQQWPSLLNHFVRAQYDPLLADFAAGETLAQFNAGSYATVPEAIARRSGKYD
jgi:hypothetical protein